MRACICVYYSHFVSGDYSFFCRTRHSYAPLLPSATKPFSLASLLFGYPSYPPKKIDIFLTHRKKSKLVLVLLCIIVSYEKLSSIADSHIFHVSHVYSRCIHNSQISNISTDSLAKLFVYHYHLHRNIINSVSCDDSYLIIIINNMHGWS